MQVSSAPSMFGQSHVWLRKRATVKHTIRWTSPVPSLAPSSDASGALGWFATIAALYHVLANLVPSAQRLSLNTLLRPRSHTHNHKSDTDVGAPRHPLTGSCGKATVSVRRAWS